MNDIQRLGALLTPSFLNCSDEDEDGPLYPEDSTGFDLMGSIVTTNCSVPQPANYTTDCLQPFFVRIRACTCVRPVHLNLATASGAVGWVPGKLNDILWTAAPQYRNVCSLRCPNPQYPYLQTVALLFSFSLPLGQVTGKEFGLLRLASQLSELCLPCFFLRPSSQTNVGGVNIQTICNFILASLHSSSVSRVCFVCHLAVFLLTVQAN